MTDAPQVGCLIFEKGEYIFKVIDHEHEILKETSEKPGKQTEKSRRSYRPGKKCDTYKRDELTQFVENLGLQNDETMGKKDLCSYLELRYREKQDQTETMYMESLDKNERPDKGLKTWFNVLPCSARK
jgi:hypothetical protein